MKKKLKKQIKNKFPLFLLILPLFLTTCDNFMMDNANFKDTLKEEVTIANADELEVLIQAETGTGTTSPSGYYTAKVGVSFNVSLQEDPEYGFIRWAAYDESDTSIELSGVVSFESATSNNTKAEILQSRSDILIMPVCEKRLSVTDQEPGGLYSEVVRNYPITVQFNKDLDPDSITDEAITIEGKLNGSYDEYVSVKSYFQDPVVSGQYMTINVATALTAGWKVRVTLDKSLYDTSGLTMTEDYSWQYLTNSSIDDTAPIINSITGATGTSASALDTPFSGSAANDHRIGNGDKNFYLSVSASDTSGVQNMSITEEQTTDEAGNGVSNAFSALVVYYPGVDYTLFEPQTTGDGIIELTISVSDVNGNSSTESTYLIVKDTTPPSAADNAAKVSYTENGKYVNDEIHFTNTGLSDENAAAVRSSTVYWRFAFDSSQTVLTDWADSSGSAAVSLQALGLDDGEDIPVYVQFADDQMNTSTWTLLSPNVDLESAPPAVTGVTITNAHTYSSTEYIGSSTASLNISGTDSLSGVSYYYLSDSSAAPTASSGGWTSVPTPSTAVDFTANYSGLSTGSHSLYLWLMDQAGNISSSHTIGPFTVDTDGPGTLSVPSDPSVSSGVLYHSGNTYYTRDGSLTFTFDASDGSGCGVAGFNTDGGTDADFTSDLTITAGQSLTVYAVDNLGNVSSGLAISVAQDNLGPTCSAMTVSSSSGYSVYLNGTAYFFHDGTLDFTASDSITAMEAFALSTISDSASPSLTWQSYGSGPETETLPAMASAGILYLHLKDKVGNTRTYHLVSATGDIGTEGRTWQSDTTPPSGAALASDTSDYANSGDYYTTGTSVAFTFNASDSGSDVAGYADSTSGTPANPVTFNAGTGAHTIYAFDNVGNYAALGSTVTVIQDNAAPAQPTVTGFSPDVDYTSGNSYYTASSDDRTISFDSNDSGSGIAGFSFTADGTPETTLTLTPEADPATPTTYTVYAIDNAGNASSALSITLVQDTTAPDIPSFDTGDAEYGYYDSTAGIYYIAGNNTDAVFISDDGAGSGIAGFADAADGTPADTVALSKDHSYTIYAFDKLGHVSASFDIDVVKDATKIP